MTSRLAHRHGSSRRANSVAIEAGAGILRADWLLRDQGFPSDRATGARLEVLGFRDGGGRMTLQCRKRRLKARYDPRQLLRKSLRSAPRTFCATACFRQAKRASATQMTT